MADPTQIVLLPTPEAAAHAAPLFSGSLVAYANGSLPPEAQGFRDAVAIGTDADWLASTCAQLAALHYDRIRYAEGDVAEIQGNPVEWVRARIKTFQNPAPQGDADGGATPPPVFPALPAADPAGAGPIEEPPEQPTSDAPPAWMDEIPDDPDAFQRSIRTASALKRQAFYDAEPDEWPEPADFWGTGTLPAFPPDCLPPQIAPYVLDQADRAGVDPAQVALNCYVACAALIRSGIDLQMQEDFGDEGRTWREKPILWGAVVGDPSTGKGPALDIALHKFFKIASVLRQKDEAAWQQYDIDSKIHERRMQSYYAEQAKVKTDLQQPTPPTKPPRERLWTDDVTKEVVAKLLTENPRGKIAIIKDELASWFGGFDAYGNGKSDKDRPDWLSFYESKERYIDRAMEGRSYHVPSWGGVILGGIQPEVLGRISGKLGADGMLQRFQIIVSQPKQRVAKRAANADAVHDWNRILENLAAMESGGRSVQLSPEAAEYMDHQVQWISSAMQSGIPPALVAALGKWEGLFGRLMLVSHCIESAAYGMRHPAALVSRRVAEQAWRWMRSLLWPHAVHFYTGMVDQGEELKSCHAFADYILGRGLRVVKPYTLPSAWTHYSRNFKTIQQRREFWARVEQSGWVRGVGQPNRNTMLCSEYRVNPRAYDGRFAEQIRLSEERIARYRREMHPSMLAQQGRQPGED